MNAQKKMVYFRDNLKSLPRTSVSETQFATNTFIIGDFSS